MKTKIFFMLGLVILGGISKGNAQNNYFAGNSSGSLITTGQDNTGVGERSMYNTSGGPSITGNYNTALGKFSLSSIGTGSDNVSLGGQSLYTATGSSNVAVGRSAGFGTATGSFNTFVGTNCGSGNNGSNNTFIGQVWGSTTAALSNTIIIADGIPSNSGGTHRIYISPNGNTGLSLGNGAPLPANRLEINSTGSFNGTPGLRFRNFSNTSYNTAAPISNRRVLTINNIGDVILVDDVVGAGITNSCATKGYIPRVKDPSGNLECSSIYDDGAGHVGFGYAGSPNMAFNVSINGTMSTGSGPYNTSDRKFKKDIKPIVDALNKIMTLEGKTYNWRKDEFKEKNFRDELQYGLIAQDVQKVIPSIVIQSENGDLAMNYIELIPVLIEAIKEQQTQINDLKTQISDNFKAQNQDLIELTNTKIISVSPNPSNDMITVSFNVEKLVQSAKLQVHDLNGNVISSLNINDRENNISRTLQKDNFGKGIYIVSLVINGKSIDTKKIVFN